MTETCEKCGQQIPEWRDVTMECRLQWHHEESEGYFVEVSHEGRVICKLARAMDNFLTAPYRVDNYKMIFCNRPLHGAYGGYFTVLKKEEK